MKKLLELEKRLRNVKAELKKNAIMGYGNGSLDSGISSDMAIKADKLDDDKKKKMEMDSDEFIDEHEKLVDTLKSPSHKDDKKEAKKQKKELDEAKDKYEDTKKAEHSDEKEDKKMIEEALDEHNEKKHGEAKDENSAMKSEKVKFQKNGQWSL